MAEVEWLRATAVITLRPVVAPVMRAVLTLEIDIAIAAQPRRVSSDSHLAR